jgi:hypothetical protein
MAVTLRKQQPSSPSAADRLKAAQAALEEVNRKLAELNEKRNAALLADDNAAAIDFGIETANLKLSARAYEDKIRLLQQAAAEQERSRREREREGVIKRIEDKLEQRNQAGAELADAVAAADRAFRKLIDVGFEVQSLWSWPPSDLPACLFSHAAITHALTHEMYRIGARPMLGGGQVEPAGFHAGIHFPGARVPRFELTHLPERIPPLTAVLQQATAHASAIMRGKRSSAQIDIPVSAPATNGNVVPRTAAHARIVSEIAKETTEQQNA